MRRFRVIKDTEMAGLQACAWGFPRNVELKECVPGAWFEYGDDSILWFTHDGDPSELQFHFVVAPEARGTINARRLMQGVELLAELAGAKRLRQTDCTPEGTVAGYLERLGFVREPGSDPPAWVKELE